MLYFEDIELNSVRKSEPYPVSKEEIIDFATRWDPQPFHTSEEEAAKWPLGLSASSVHTIAISAISTFDLMDDRPAAIAGLGWDEVRMPHPVRPGDVLVVHAYVETKRESKSKPHLGVITSCVEVYNQDSTLVLSYKSSSLIMKRPENTAAPSTEPSTSL